MGLVGNWVGCLLGHQVGYWPAECGSAKCERNATDDPNIMMTLRYDIFSEVQSKSMSLEHCLRVLYLFQNNYSVLEL